MFSCVGILHDDLQNGVMSQLYRAGRSRVTAGVAVSFLLTHPPTREGRAILECDARAALWAEGPKDPGKDALSLSVMHGLLCGPRGQRIRGCLLRPPHVPLCSVRVLAPMLFMDKEDRLNKYCELTWNPIRKD